MTTLTKDKIRHVDDQTNTSPTLLTLAISDVSTTGSASSMAAKNSQKKREKEAPPLLLLQLPPSIAIEDILPKKKKSQESSSSGPSAVEPPAQIRIREESDPSWSEIIENNGKISSSSGGGQKTNECNLIFEELGKSYNLIRAETSNAYVLVPPALIKRKQTDNYNAVEEEEETTTTIKKRKVMTFTNNDKTTDKELVHMKAQLLRESRTFFLECTALHSDTNVLQKRRRVLHELLSQCVFPFRHDDDNDNDDNLNGTLEKEEEEVGGMKENHQKGYTLQELSTILSCSKKEVKDLFQSMDEVFPLPNTECNGDEDDNNTKHEEQKQRYGFLSEEVEQTAFMNIIYTLAEWDGGNDYYQKGVHLEQMVNEVLKRGEEEEKGVISDCVVRYCLGKCRLDDKEEGKDIVRLDVDKIALFLAHYLFNSQTDSWEKSNFLSEWNRLMPGVGDCYEPKEELLKGVALESRQVHHTSAEAGNATEIDDIETESVEIVRLKYFPRDTLPLGAMERFAALFKVQKRWSREELDPYLEVLAKSKSAISEILLKNACAIPDSDGTVWYSAKH